MTPPDLTPEARQLIYTLELAEKSAEDEWRAKWPNDLGRGPYAPTFERAHDTILALLAEVEGLTKEREDHDRWYIRMADIREASGVGVKPMLDEVPDAIRKRIAGIEAERDAALSRVQEAREHAREALSYIPVDATGWPAAVRALMRDIIALQGPQGHE